VGQKIWADCVKGGFLAILWGIFGFSSKSPGRNDSAVIEREFVPQDHINALRHHFVGLVAHSRKLDNVHFLSGFILRFEDDWLWCSAGHCVEEVEAYLDAGDAGFALQFMSEQQGSGIPIILLELLGAFSMQIALILDSSF